MAFIQNEPPAGHEHSACPHDQVQRPRDLRGFEYDYLVCLRCGDRQHDVFNDQTA